MDEYDAKRYANELYECVDLDFDEMGFIEIINRIYNEAYDQGWEDGKISGYDEGYEEGYDAGLEDDE